MVFTLTYYVVMNELKFQLQLELKLQIFRSIDFRVIYRL